jgi:hypothetical protein
VIEGSGPANNSYTIAEINAGTTIQITAFRKADSLTLKIKAENK